MQGRRRAHRQQTLRVHTPAGWPPISPSTPLIRAAYATRRAFLLPLAAVCDEVPECLRDRIMSFEGTSLIDTVSSANKGAGENTRGTSGVVCLVCCVILMA